MQKNNSPVTTRITRIGNSRGIILPNSIIRSLALEEGDRVDLVYDNLAQSLVVTFPTTKQLTLTPTLHNH